MSNNTIIRSILDKFEIEKLNPMQETAFEKIQTGKDVVLLSPTGTGKTLAFLLPLIETLDENCDDIQIVIIVPTRELAQQIEQVARKMGTGFKINSVYGGRAGVLDKQDLKHKPAILIGTPGRVADRLRRDNFSVENIRTLVLDEYDKSLEIGFDKEMTEIVEALPNVEQRILTSATSDVGIPLFLGLTKPIFINFIKEENSKLKIKTISSPSKDKLETLKKTLEYIGLQNGIVFCNFKDSLERISDFLNENGFRHETFHGSMEQIERERALVKFRNGTSQLLLATDLAARGIDIPELKFIIHYHLPLREKEFIHRNGRTARMNNDGVSYILYWEGEELPDFIQEIDAENLKTDELPKTTHKPAQKWETLHISGGRRDKISKGDIAGLFFKQGKINKNQLGIIEVQQSVSFVAVHSSVAKKMIQKLNNSKLKTKKVRITMA